MNAADQQPPLSDRASPLFESAGYRGEQAMSRESAEAIALRIVLHLYRGSIELAREALEDGWADHVRENQPLPIGTELLDVPLSRVIEGVRLLNTLEENGILTVGHLLSTSQAELLSICGLGNAALTKLVDLGRVLRERAQR